MFFLTTHTRNAKQTCPFLHNALAMRRYVITYFHIFSFCFHYYRGRGHLARGLGKRFIVIFVNYVNNANYVKRR